LDVTKADATYGVSTKHHLPVLTWVTHWKSYVHPFISFPHCSIWWECWSFILVTLELCFAENTEVCVYVHEFPLSWWCYCSCVKCSYHFVKVPRLSYFVPSNMRESEKYLKKYFKYCLYQNICTHCLCCQCYCRRAAGKTFITHRYSPILILNVFFFLISCNTDRAVYRLTLISNTEHTHYPACHKVHIFLIVQSHKSDQFAEQINLQLSTARLSIGMALM